MPHLSVILTGIIGRTVFHLPENVVGNQYLEVLRILVPLYILVPLLVSAKI